MKAIVTGVSGQDGYYMAALLAARGIAVLGLTTNVEKARREFAASSVPRLELQAFDYTRPGAIAPVLEAWQPDYVFNFAAKATGAGMFDTPCEISRLNGAFVLEILEAIRGSGRSGKIAFCQASSSEMFGNVQETPQVEETPFRPKSPYGAAKLYAHNLIGIYRAAYGLCCSSAILYNHESIRRPPQFVTKKIAMTAAMIKLGLAQELTLGALETMRDWGYAPEYMEALYLMATAPKPDDYIVATGQLNSIETLCEIAFSHLGLEYKRFVRSVPDVQRRFDSVDLCGNPGKIKHDLNWSSRRTVSQIMIEMVDHEMVRLRTSV